MRKSLVVLCVALLVGLVAAPVLAADFTNGGFESGNLTGWTQGGGYWGYFGSAPWPMDPESYLPGHSNYDAAPMTNTVVGPGTDSISGLNTVFNGNYSVRVNDSYNNYSVSVISQTVPNYTNPNIYFAWQADLQGSHGLTDSDNFTLELTDDTKGTSLYNVSYSSASAVGTSLFSYNSAYGWYYTAWQTENLDVSADLGDTLTLTLLASDCPYGGHAGYVYLDGFGAAPPVQGPANTPEPSSLMLLGSGMALIAMRVRSRLGR